MAKDEKEKYTQLISEKEVIADNLKDEQKKIVASLQDLHEVLHRGYRTLSLLHEEEIQEGNVASINAQRREEEQEQFFKRELIALEEHLSGDYAKQQKKFEDDIEELYQKRSESTWD